MSPNIQARQLLVWTSIPTIAVLIYTSFLWYKRKRSVKEADPGEIKMPGQVPTTPISIPDEKPAPIKRSLSGVETAPIDIVLPERIRAGKAASIVISDEELDLHIPKRRSVKSPYSNIEKIVTPRVRSALTMELEKSKRGNMAASQPITIIAGTPKPTTSSLEKSPRKNKSRQAIKKENDRTVSSAAEKLNSLTITEKVVETNGTDSAMNTSVSTNGVSDSRQSSDRDSANNSPADVMLSSPSLSIISDNQSEGSSDSGKGGSDVVTPARDGSLSGDLTTDDHITLYEFEILQTMVGRLIGRRGCFVQEIKTRTKASIIVKPHPDTDDLKLCTIEGTAKEIKEALEMIRKKFPKKQYSNLTLEQVYITIPQNPTIPKYNYLKLVECIHNDTIMSHVETPVHLFLHFHTHPTFRGLQRLVDSMKQTYSQNDPQQLFPTTPTAGQMCVAPLEDLWYRAQIVSTNAADDTSDIQFLDFGGFCKVDNSALRQIHYSFISLPFQAAECILANIRLRPDADVMEGVAYVSRITSQCLLQTSIVGYTEENIPRVFVYFINAHNEIYCLNDEVVAAGFAEYEEVTSDQQTQV